MTHLRTTFNACLLIACLIGMTGAAAVAGGVSLSPGLSRLVAADSGPADSLVAVVVFLETADGFGADRMAPDPTMTRAARIKTVSNRLQSYRPVNGEAIERYLLECSDLSVVKFWIAPAYAATVPVSRLAELAAMTGVRLVVENATVSFDAPVEISRTASSLAAAVAAPLVQLNVPSLWQQGLTGQGRLVCSFDTGVEYDHPALAAKWRGNSAALSASWFSKVSPDNNPGDIIGHGTHTMGIMVGSADADNFGVAPGAEWIAAGVIDQGRPLETTISDILESFQWALNPDGDSTTTDDVPDVILNSWGIPKGLFEPCDLTFATVIENVEEAGIVTIFAAGNEGPNPMTLRYPADMANNPLNAFSVGAVDNSSVIASFSSRGPSSCDQTSIKPELVAPGVAIRSSFKNGEYRVLSGTSMAAPYIAGLVALMREYNPDATVAQIKNAMIAAATDLGTFGEDNAYGHGLINAARLLEYLPVPGEPEFSISGIRISDDGVPSPGEQIGIQITLANPVGNVDQAVGTLVSLASGGVTLILDQATFAFGLGGTTATNFSTFAVLLDGDLYNGERLPFELHVSFSGGDRVDTLTFELTVGYLPNGHFATHTTNQMNLTVSDFGQLGLAPGSIYNTLGDGFRVGGSENLLYEAGIILGRNSLQISSAVRDSYGHYQQSDFGPISALSDAWIGADGGSHRSAQFNDQFSAIPIPVTVHQETVCFPNFDNNALVIFDTYLRNDGVETITNLHFGLLADFDLGDSETVAYDPDLNMMYQQGNGGPGAALIGLKNVTSFQAFDNGAGKLGFTREEMFSVISSGAIDANTGTAGDKFFVVGAGPFTIAPGDSVAVAFAFVGGYGSEEVYANAVTASQLFDTPTDFDDEPLTSLPGDFQLHQNYPNPFNPTTMIAFDLPAASDVSLEVYNTLGQQVTTLHEGLLPAGSHEIEWDATDRDGSAVASGMYFYRLVSESASQTRKMVLLK